MNRKEIDFDDILGPPTIRINEYVDKKVPFNESSWVNNSDLTILELAKILPQQLPFLYTLIHEHPDLLPGSNNIPGKIQELVCVDILEKLKSRSPRDHKLERKIRNLWIKCGGHKTTIVKGE